MVTGLALAGGIGGLIGLMLALNALDGLRRCLLERRTARRRRRLFGALATLRDDLEDAARCLARR